MSDHELSDRIMKTVSSLRSSSSIYRRDKAILEKAPNDEARGKALHYVTTEEGLRDYFRDQYAVSGVRVREYKLELEKRLQGRMPAAPPVDFFRPDDPAGQIFPAAHSRCGNELASPGSRSAK